MTHLLRFLTIVFSLLDSTGCMIARLRAVLVSSFLGAVRLFLRDAGELPWLQSSVSDDSIGRPFGAAGARTAVAWIFLEAAEQIRASLRQERGRRAVAARLEESDGRYDRVRPMSVRRVMVDHVLFVVADLDASRRLYTAALAPLGYGELYVQDDCVSYGAEDLDDFTICQGEPVTTAAHVAFSAEGREEVDAFFEAAVANGATIRGEPGVWTRYS